MTNHDIQTGTLQDKEGFPTFNKILFFVRRNLGRLTENPVITKELRGRMRGRRSFLLLTSYLGLISLIIGVIYFLLSRELSFSQYDPEFRQTVGKVIFGAVVLLELLMVTFIGPALTVGAITSEREKQTYDLLRTTLLSARSLVFGKLGSALIYLLLLIFAAMPIEALAFLLGGVGFGELVVSSLMLVVTAFFFCSLGLFYSSFVKRTLTATVSSYATILVSSLLLALGLIVVTYFLDSTSRMGPVFENMLGILLLMMISTNPLLSAIVTEIVLIEDQSLFVIESIFSTNFWLPSPWITFTIIYLIMTTLSIILSIRFINRPDR